MENELLRDRVGGYSLGLSRIWFNTLRCNNMAEVPNFVPGKVALVRFQLEASMLKASKHCLQQTQVFSERGAKNNNVV